MTVSQTDRLYADDLSVAFGRTVVLPGLSLSVPDGKVTVIVGANACGKSTLLRALARLKAPAGGQVVLDGRNIAHRSTREVARTLGMLPQMPTAPEGIRVFDLVERGRTPHQSVLRQWSKADALAVETALDRTGMSELGDRFLHDLSGGQRQRAWIAMALAQETDLLLLDEPTTFLDLAHQIELLDLIRDLNRTAGRTVVMVLHDINLAARYADHMIGLKDGRLIAQGTAEEVVTEAGMRAIFDLDCMIIRDPVKGTPLVVPC